MNGRIFVMTLCCAGLCLGSQGAGASEHPLQALLDGCTRSGAIPGAVAMLGNRDGVIFSATSGRKHIARQAPMTTHTQFAIASMTKPITSVAVLQLAEQGKLDLDAPLARYLPRFAHVQVLEGFDDTGVASLRPARSEVTVRQLLTHTSGYVYELWNQNAAQAAEQGLVAGIIEPGDDFLDAPLAFDPGTAWEYGISTDILGVLVAAVSGQEFPDYVQQHILKPLGMFNTHFVLPAQKLAILATTHVRGPDGSLIPLPYQAPDPGFVSGGGGLYSTANDYLRFLRAILNGGVLDKQRVLGQESVAAMTSNQIGDLRIEGKVETFMPQFSNSFDMTPGVTDQFGFGFLINIQATPTGMAAGSLAWGGLFNTYFWIDPKNDVVGLLMTQMLPFWDEAVAQLLAQFQQQAYQSLGLRPESEYKTVTAGCAEPQLKALTAPTP